ncbi:MAG: hypothetical protein SH808_13725 [Saprospiraceae bacterium]|nr:hypothetical protein [Saprospiraceae bacterium]
MIPVLTTDRLSLALRVAVAIFVLLVWLPFLLLSFYNVPIGMHEWDWMTMEAGQLKGNWLDTQVYFYREVMGRISSTAILSLTSSWCSLSTFPFFFFFWQILWVATLFLVIRTLFRQASMYTQLVITFGIQMIYLCNLEDVYDTMFRYTGVLTYQAGFVFGLFCLVFIVWSRNGLKQSGLKVLVALCFMVLCIGTNEISMLFVLLTIGVVFYYNAFVLRKRNTIILIALMLAVIFSIIVVAAPGNGIRVDAEDGGLSLLQLSVITLGATVYLWTDWLTASLLPLMTILAIPLMQRIGASAQEHSLFKDYKPWLWILLGSIPVTIGPLIYATGGDTFPERVIDHLFIHVIFLWMGLFVSLAVKYNVEFEVEKVAKHRLVRFSYLICLGFVLFNVFGNGLGVNRKDKANRLHYVHLIQSSSTITNAWLALARGEPQAYHKASIDQLNRLNTCVMDTCFMRKPEVIPSQLYDSLSDRRNRNGDPYLGYYFNPRIKRVIYYPQKARADGRQDGDALKDTER